MGRFYFHLRAGSRLLHDYEGQVLPDVSAARREAERSARELLADAIKASKVEAPEAFVIADEHGCEIGTFPFAEVLPKPFSK